MADSGALHSEPAAAYNTEPKPFPSQQLHDNHDLNNNNHNNNITNTNNANPAEFDNARVEAPVTWKAYMMCAFAAFGGIFFGFDSGYINGVLGMKYFIHMHTNKPYSLLDDPATKDQFQISSSQKSLIVSILSLGTFIGALIAGDLADWFGRRTTVIAGCGVFAIGVVLQIASASGLGLIVPGRLIAGLGVGFVSATIILYMSEIAPRKIRGALVSGYQFCITIGLLLASCVTYGTQERMDSGSYRIPIAIQLVWALILAGGLAFLPESPRYFVRKGDNLKARRVLARVRGQPESSEYIDSELAEMVANHEFESRLVAQSTGNRKGYFSTWLACFSGKLSNPSSNLRRTLLGISLQMMQQWTGVNFIFYFGTTFFQQLNIIENPFIISMITTVINVASTPISFWTIERFGRRPLMFWGAVGMVVCQFIVAIAGTVDGNNPATLRAMIAFICIYIFFFASTWGPGAWVIIGEIFPLQIRSRGVALSTASNWMWNCIIAVITPYMVGPDKGNLKAKVFFIWGSLCAVAAVYSYVFIYETKGLSLEQVDLMMAESTPATSSKWTPSTSFAAQMAQGGPGLSEAEKRTNPTGKEVERASPEMA